MAVHNKVHLRLVEGRHVCSFCLLQQGVEKSKSHGVKPNHDFTASDVLDMLQHLRLHLQAGHEVPNLKELEATLCVG